MSFCDGVVVTTLPNLAISRQVSPEAFKARTNVAKAAMISDISAGHRLIALCERSMLPHFSDVCNRIHNWDDAMADNDFQRNKKDRRVLFLEDPGSENTTMGHGRRLIIELATHMFPLTLGDEDITPVIIWREPEKDIAKFIGAICEPIVSNIADIVIPRRKSLASYPKFSQAWESTGSMMASYIIGGEPQDYWVGPRAFHLAAAKYFLNYPGEQTDLPDWHDCIFGPIVDAVADGKRVAGVEIDFEYPEEQRLAEENDGETMKKRMQVMLKLLGAIVARKQWRMSRQ